MSQPVRIPSLDGGGIMGAFAAAALVAVVRESDRRIVENDGLMTGTSIDGIIATGLATGASA